MLDTNTASYIIKGNPPKVRQRLNSVSMEQVCISSITQAELLYGLARHINPGGLKIAIHEFLLRVDILSWDSEAADCYAVLRAKLEKAGKCCGNMDMMIAAHALSANTILITSDKGFRHMDKLQLENWTH